MITVKRLTGQPFAINPDLIERIECTPDTILVLMDGTKYIVDESMDQIVEMVREHRAAVISRSLRAPVPGSPPADGRHDDSVIVPLPTRSSGK